ncbi:uncharacterized protein N7484_001562 [Penicillium longicatenatum]|uniref:uncharacterized protein n=1 Tax=Penicillium longicatenatum TaxID=1561947 RepID=UPI002547F3A9|nr:uncharacterized protein N7484_001562 [Penicillium longicatenatum]KAJ5657913.1 hypothetical protein N7484_001562 [Penicillium longicatenatum]
MPAPSLLQLAMATAVKHVKSLNDIGNLPYNLVRPILLKVDNPEKLHAMEVLSPHLIEEDKELWLNFIRRDIPQWEQYELPENTHQWYEIYCDLREDVQRALDADAEKMKMALDGIKSERTRLTPKIIRGHESRRSRFPSKSFRPRTFTGIPGISADKKKSAIFSAPRRNNALAVPTKHLSTRASQVKKAPISLIEEHRQPTEQPVKQPVPTVRRDQGARVPVAPAMPRRQSSYTPPRPVHETRRPALAEREARLRAIASGNPLPASSEGTRKVPTHTRDAASTRPTSLKREAVSPPPGARLSSHSSLQRPGQTDGPASPPASARPVMPVRKRPDSVFIQPKRRRII